MPMIKIKDFLQLEAAAGIALFLTAVLAIIFVNSPFSNSYEAILNTLIFNSPFIFWVNDGLMAIFFLLVGLELKREFLEGELSGKSKIVLPGVAALGGMIVPVIIYVIFNYSSKATMVGWPIPVATDIAFALGVLSLFSNRIPLALKLFLLALAVFDDLGAIVIIAVFFSHGFSLAYFIAAIMIFLLLLFLNRFLKVDKLFPYIILGAILWFFVLQSGVHASISGVLLALVIPLKKHSSDGESSLHKLEKFLHPWVAFLILPLFAFCNAGLSFAGASWSILLQPIVLGITLGLFIGKQVGVMSFVTFMTKFKFSKWPESVSFLDMYGIALLCGIGFTMSLFLGTLAFHGDQVIHLSEVRLGVFLGSVLSAVCGSLSLHISYLQKCKNKA
ncbi:Na+/H+ antiporter NhaA [Gammaproteobacteria bacterium]|nr:Na+/H+ antiporter NhaA [Gammaproteobacteria bacterium]